MERRRARSSGRSRARTFAHADDALCAALVGEVARDLAIGCLNLARILDPQVIVLAGGVSNAGPRLADLVNAARAQLCSAISPCPFGGA